MPVEKKSVSLSSSMIEQIATRGVRSTIIERDLKRLYTLYRRSLAQIKMTVDEACLITDVLNGSLNNANTARLLWAEVQDAIDLDKIDQKWKIDGKMLVEKVRSLNEIQCMATIDAAERFWNNGEYVDGDFREGVANCFCLDEGTKQ